jgi:hypothetical protein
MARISALHKKWMKKPKYRMAYEALEDEFVLADAVIDARVRSRMSVGKGFVSGHDFSRAAKQSKDDGFSR